LNGVLW
jgi:hypothetical protein